MFPSGTYRVSRITVSGAKRKNSERMKRGHLESFALCTWIAIALLGATLPALAGAYTARIAGVDDISYVNSVKRISPPRENGEPEYPCQATIGDEIVLEVVNLDLWIEEVLRQRGVVSDKKNEQLIADTIPNLCLVVDGHAMLTLKVSSWFHMDWKRDEMKAEEELRNRLDREKTALEKEFAGQDTPEAKAKWEKFTTSSRAIDEQIKRGRIIPSYDYLHFVLTRSETDTQSKTDWNRPLRREGLKPLMHLSIGWPQGNGDTIDGIPLVNQGDGDVKKEFRLKRIPGSSWVVSGIVVIGLALSIFLFMARTTTLVRDPEGRVRLDGLPPYSLGRCQMAFWFFLVASAFFFLWLVTGRGDLDTINGSTLTLIGISAGTALGAAFIESRNDQTDATPAPPLAPEQIPYPDRIRSTNTKLEAIRAELRAVPASDTARIDNLEEQRRAAETEVRNLEQQLRTYRSTRRNEFLFDLLKERGIVSFHRFQIVVWTLVLGIVFVSGVITKLAMPNFDQTLLLLMGISSGTYLGFKLPGGSKP
jgi:hypothetical protein